MKEKSKAKWPLSTLFYDYEILWNILYVVFLSSTFAARSLFLSSGENQATQICNNVNHSDHLNASS